MISFQLFLPSLETASILVLPILGMYLTSRILRVDDLTIEGSFGLAGATTALLLTYGYHPILCIFCAIIAAGIAGACTGIIHQTLRISVLMSSIIVSTGIFSCNLLIAGANLSVTQTQTLFLLLPKNQHSYLVITGLIALFCITSLWLILQTTVGYFFRASGANPAMVEALGKRPLFYHLGGIIGSNMLTGLAGSLFVQYVGFFSIWSSVGIMITTLAGLMLAELINKEIGLHLFLGALAYQSILLLTFEFECNADWNKLITACCIVGLLCIKRFVLKEHAS